jgi:hypothetical protein
MAKNQRGSNFISAGVAIIAVGLFLGWLATREPPQSVAVAEPGDTTDAATLEPIDESEVTVLSPDQVSHSARLDDLQGEAVRMNGVNVVGNLGEQMFWIELSSGDLYLVKLADPLVEAGVRPPTSGVVDIVGHIQQKNAARLDIWMQSGVLQSEEDRMQAEFGLTYMEAQRVQPAGD